MAAKNELEKESASSTQSRGKWAIISKKDPRFNRTGEGLVGSFIIPDNIMDALEDHAHNLRARLPDDIKYTWARDKA